LELSAANARFLFAIMLQTLQRPVLFDPRLPSQRLCCEFVRNESKKILMTDCMWLGGEF
jgi:hypothetical protein